MKDVSFTLFFPNSDGAFHEYNRRKSVLGMLVHEICVKLELFDDYCVLSKCLTTDKHH